MINPTDDEFDEIPISASADVGEERRRGQRRLGQTSGSAWEQTKEKAGAAAERTQIFLRENPVPTLLGALGIGIAIGLAIRYASNAAEPEEKARGTFGEAALSFLSFPFLWPLMKSIKTRADDSAEAMKEGVDRLKKVKVSRYTKPLRKKVRSWTR
jgi:ElaB/YqjD/DUF883 family membrane-anchored ribosome-binding protein